MRHPSDPDPAAARRLFRATLAGTLAVRLLLAWRFPVIGDEAYLFGWARDLAWGYYDHPPLAAWLLSPFFALGLDSPFFLRLPSVALYPLLSLVLVRLLRRFDTDEDPERNEARAWLAGALFLLLPVHVVGVLMLTDVVLVLLVGLAGAALFRTVALRDDALPGYAAAGALLGLALLTKYLAALLAAAFAVWLALSWRGGGGGPARRRLAGFALLVACAVPFVALHLEWNAGHCWSTVLFNLFSRHAGESKNYSVPRNLLFFALAHLWVLGPPVLGYLLRPRGIRRRLAELGRVARSDAFRPAALAFAVPTALLALSAATLLFGAYWILPFALFFFLVVPRVLTPRELRRSIAFLAVFSGFQAAVLAVALALPLAAFRGAGFHDSLVTMERTGEILAELEAIEELRQGGHLVAPGYSFASILSYRRGRPVPVFGEGSHYGRQDDLSTDFRTFDGDDVVMVSKRPIRPEAFDRWFEEVERRQLEVEGVTLHAAVGRGFDFPAYRRDVLVPIRDRWYRPAPFLPDCGCPFRERYFPDGEEAPGTRSAA
jgi:4-amino-4-deoxy-L-arabinose transferase-like glycosyltransferase